MVMKDKLYKLNGKNKHKNFRKFAFAVLGVFVAFFSIFIPTYILSK